MKRREEKLSSDEPFLGFCVHPWLLLSSRQESHLLHSLIQSLLVLVLVFVVGGGSFVLFVFSLVLALPMLGEENYC